MTLAVDAPAGGAPAPGPAPTSAGTSTAPTGRGLWRRARTPLLAALVLVLVSLAVAALRATGGGTLDPRSYAPEGSRALAALLEQQGVSVRVVGDLDALRSGLGPGSTVLVPLPGLLTPDELAALGGLDSPVVVAGAGPDDVAALDLPVDVAPADTAVRRPACALPAAGTAGAALSGTATYAPQDGVDAVGCYATGGRASLLQLPGRQVVLLGEPAVLTNDELDREGDAALALGLLGGGDEVRWLLPAPGRAVPGAPQSLRDLLPDSIELGVLQLAVAVLALGLWRARRLGRVVTEPLPVVVRAAEAAEGRGRLYRAAGARGTAAEALRAGARDRLARRLSLPPATEPDRLVEVLASRSGRAAGEVGALLYGAPPPDDAALVRLARALDELRLPPGPAPAPAPHVPPPAPAPEAVDRDPAP